MEVSKKECYVSKSYKNKEQEYRVIKINIRKDVDSTDLIEELQKINREKNISPAIRSALELGTEWKFHGTLGKVGEFSVVKELKA